ncbi:hypothetical protein HMPREF3223_01688 [Cutibacterium avidum]|uniref:TraA protein n=1 Tax=Cutibacterium avidum ATCC 25577 TaxID=997355 RepID=G4CZP3_9ACTN|nr:TraA protein [Cutibacterium avidum ATCC 25577]KXA66541.1 hypothetical protein HMPREF3223_01688 [Cutibacterium avidum]
MLQPPHSGFSINLGVVSATGLSYVIQHGLLLSAQGRDILALAPQRR